MKTMTENKMSDPFNLVKYFDSKREVCFSGIDSSTFEFIKNNFSKITNDEVFIFEHMDQAKLAFEIFETFILSLSRYLNLLFSRKMRVFHV